MLSDLHRPVLVLAGEAEHGVAMQFVHDLGALRDGVAEVSGNDVAVRRQLALSGPKATLVVIDLRRYERWVLDAVALAADAGHTIVALHRRAAVAAGDGGRQTVHARGAVRRHRSTATSARWRCSSSSSPRSPSGSVTRRRHGSNGSSRRGRPHGRSPTGDAPLLDPLRRTAGDHAGAPP